jgi:non-heme chloroperoxidase
LFQLAIAQRDGISGAKLVPIEACGHFLFYDQKDIFNRELVKFTE